MHFHAHLLPIAFLTGKVGGCIFTELRSMAFISNGETGAACETTIANSWAAVATGSGSITSVWF